MNLVLALHFHCRLPDPPRLHHHPLNHKDMNYLSFHSFMSTNVYMYTYIMLELIISAFFFHFNVSCNQSYSPKHSNCLSIFYLLETIALHYWNHLSRVKFQCQTYSIKVEIPILSPLSSKNSMSNLFNKSFLLWNAHSSSLAFNKRRSHINLEVLKAAEENFIY